MEEKIMEWDVILSGPITGRPEYKREFAQAVVKVHAVMRGVKIWNPAELPAGREYRWYMVQCTEAILKGAKDGCVLVTLEGWQDSPGARAEVALAESVGMRVVGVDELTGEWLKRGEV